jgi:hypothetical protein
LRLQHLSRLLRLLRLRRLVRLSRLLRLQHLLRLVRLLRLQHLLRLLRLRRLVRLSRLLRPFRHRRRRSLPRLKWKRRGKRCCRCSRSGIRLCQSTGSCRSGSSHRNRRRTPKI